jgi:hypothetical protein
MKREWNDSSYQLPVRTRMERDLLTYSRSNENGTNLEWNFDVNLNQQTILEYFSKKAKI